MPAKAAWGCVSQMAEGPDLEAGHFLERSWASLFHMPEATGCAAAPEP